MKVRNANPADLPFLGRMLFEAFHWDPEQERPPFQAFMEKPEISRLLAGWGREGDNGVIAEIGATPIGAAWCRQWRAQDNTYGFVDEQTPELGIAVELAHRSKGIGKALLDALLSRARANGFEQISLSVEPHNPAHALYKSRGFVKVGESGTSWTLKLALQV